MSIKNENLSDWQPGQYLKFEDYRTQPANDLAARIAVKVPAHIIDLGCGPGNSTAVLRAHWPEAQITGLDSSRTMLDKARHSFPEGTWLQRSLTENLSDLGRFDIVFSNAVLQWIPDVDQVIPRLFELLNPGGALAFQIPFSGELPSHQAMYTLVKSPAWSHYFSDPVEQPVYHSVSAYYEILSKLTEHLSLWETRYIQVMHDHSDIVEWNKGSALRPYLEALPDDSTRTAFLEEYDAAIRQAYPAERNGFVLYPFARIFAVAYRI